MPIRFRCAYCNQLMGIARRKAGQVVKCPKCAGEIIVPVPEGMEQPDAAEQPADLGGAFDDANFDPAGVSPAPDSAAVTAAAPKHTHEPMTPLTAPAPKRVGVFLSIGMLFVSILVITLLLILMFVLGMIVCKKTMTPAEPKASLAGEHHVVG